jgi:hypothetical protein
LSSTLLVHALVVGGAVLALWIYVRLGERRPTSFRVVCAHVLLAAVGLALAPRGVAMFIGDSTSPFVLSLGLFALFLPTMTYLFLTALFFLDRIQRSMLAR